MKAKKLFATLLAATSTLCVAGCDNKKPVTPSNQQVEQVTVTFNVNGGSDIANVTVNKGTKINKPADPTKAGYEFKGWFKDSECKQPWDFATDVVSSNTTLYAKWEQLVVVEKFTVSFDSKGGSAVNSLTDIQKGSKITKPADPTRDGFNFLGWYKDQAYQQQWVFETDTVESNTTLYAKWEAVAVDEQKFTITFDSKGGSAVENMTDVVKGSTITKPANPTRDGFNFLGWYKDEAYQQQWVFETDTVEGNITLYAKWEAVAAYENSIFSEDFSKYKDGDKLEQFASFHSQWGKSGLYMETNAPDYTGNYVEIQNGVASLVDTTEKSTRLVLDYGSPLFTGVVEGKFEMNLSNVGSSWTLVQFNGSKQLGEKISEVVGIRTDKLADKSVVFKLRFNGGAAVDPLNNVVCQDGTKYEVYYKFDLNTAKLTLTINNQALCEDYDISQVMASLSGVKFVSSDSNARTMTVDNISTTLNLPALDQVKATQKANLQKVYETYDPALYTGENKTQLETALQTGLAAIDAANTADEVIAAYVEAVSAFSTVLTDEQAELASYKEQAIADLKQYNNTDFTINAEDYNQALADGIKLIQEATSKEDVDAKLAEAKTLIDAVDNDTEALAGFKEEYKTKLKNLANDLRDNHNFSIETLEQKLNEGLTAIEAALNAEEVLTAYANAEEQLKAIPDDQTVLNEAISKAIEDLNAYRSTEIEALKETEAEIMAQIQKAISDACDKISSATDLEEIKDIVAKTKSEVDELISSAGQDITSLKESATQDLNKLLEEIKQEYESETELITEISDLINKAISDISSQTDKAEVTKILNEAQEAVENLVAEHELTKAKANANTELEQYLKDKKEEIQAHNSELAEQLNEDILNEAKQFIEKVEDLKDIEEALTLAKDKIDEKYEELITTEFEVSFGNTEMENSSVQYGQKFTKPEDPVKEGFVFGEWFKNADLTELFDFEEVQYDDVQLYAKWFDALVETDGESESKTSFEKVPELDEKFELDSNNYIQFHFESGATISDSALKITGASQKAKHIKLHLDKKVTLKIVFYLSSAKTEGISVWVDTSLDNTKPSGKYETAYAKNDKKTFECEVEAGDWYINRTNQILISEITLTASTKTVTKVTGFDESSSVSKVEYTSDDAQKGITVDDLAGLKLALEDKDSIDVTDERVKSKITIEIDKDTEFNNGISGSYTVTVKYGEYTTTTFTVTVLE